MTRSLTTVGEQSIHALETAEAWLPLLKLTQGGWSLLITPNDEPVEHQGETYIPFAFEVALPDEQANVLPTVEWVCDNVDQRVVEGLRTVDAVIDARLVWVRADAPEDIEIGPFNLKLRGASYTAGTLSGALTVDPVLDRPLTTKTFSPETAPGLF